MGNVNRFITKVILPILVILYTIYLIFDYVTFDNANSANIIDKKKEIAQDTGGTYNLILGGSNAYFGLSASILTKKTGDAWLNIALLNEGFTDSNYWRFVSASISEKQRLSIKNVVYSSMTPFGGDDTIKSKMSLNNFNKDILGRQGVSLVPSISIVSRLKGYISKRDEFEYPLPDVYGDFDFSHFECKVPSYSFFKADASENQIRIWIRHQSSELKKLFPNATIYFVMPSVYVNTVDQDKILILNERIKNAINFYNLQADSNIVFIAQSFIPSQNLLCDTLHHPNNTGRIWRTNNLIELIKKVEYRRPIGKV